jgi:hypothetical protein
MQVALVTISLAHSKGMHATADAVTHILNYCASHPDTMVHYHASNMILHVHSDAS